MSVVGLSGFDGDYWVEGLLGSSTEDFCIVGRVNFVKEGG
jgi:hypothetical protein